MLQTDDLEANQRYFLINLKTEDKFKTDEIVNDIQNKLSQGKKIIKLKKNKNNLCFILFRNA